MIKGNYKELKNFDFGFTEKDFFKELEKLENRLKAIKEELKAFIDDMYNSDDLMRIYKDEKLKSEYLANRKKESDLKEEQKDLGTIAKALNHNLINYLGIKALYAVENSNCKDMPILYKKTQKFLDTLETEDYRFYFICYPYDKGLIIKLKGKNFCVDDRIYLRTNEDNTINWDEQNRMLFYITNPKEIKKDYYKRKKIINDSYKKIEEIEKSMNEKTENLTYFDMRKEKTIYFY